MVSGKKKIAFVYPGQGAQHVGMGKDVYDASQAARAAFNDASEALGEDIAAMVFSGSDEELTLTRNTQPALLTVCTALTRALAEAGVRKPDVAAGLSIGEYSAWVEAGLFGFKDAARIVRLRGDCMQNEVPAGLGGMAAILGLSAEDAAACCAQAQEGLLAAGSRRATVEPANYNCPGQVVIAGYKEAVAEASRLCREKGAKRAVELAVSAPFHCSLLKGAQEKLAAALAGVELSEPSIPVAANVTGEYARTAAEARELLARQVSSAVRWEACVRAMLADGVCVFVEIGPGKTLAGFIKKIDKDAAVLGVSDAAGVEAAAKALSAL